MHALAIAHANFGRREHARAIRGVDHAGGRFPRAIGIARQSPHVPNQFSLPIDHRKMGVHLRVRCGRFRQGHEIEALAMAEKRPVRVPVDLLFGGERQQSDLHQRSRTIHLINRDRPLLAVDEEIQSGGLGFQQLDPPCRARIDLRLGRNRLIPEAVIGKEPVGGFGRR